MLMDAHWHVGGSETDTRATYHGHWVKEQKQAFGPRERERGNERDKGRQAAAHCGPLQMFVRFFSGHSLSSKLLRRGDPSR